MSNVSDEEAMRALLSSAEARSREREGGADGGRGRGGRGHYYDGGRGRGRRGRWEDGNASRKRSRFGNLDDDHKNDSYYGPNIGDRERSRQRQRHDNENSNAVRVEPDDTGKKGEEGDNEEEEETPRQQQFKPNFGLSGALSKDTQSGNVYKGVVLKFKEPPEARAPNTQWRFYVFKKGQKDAIETLHISKQSAYLMGRNIDIADIPMHHPSLSGQHAVLQYRALPSKANEGRLSCQPYIMDLESTNGTFVNGVKIDPARYYQLKRGDVLTFGASTREYVLLTENTTKT